MKYIFSFIFISLIIEIFSQSKKEKIEILNIRVDSLYQILNFERNSNSKKTADLSATIVSLENKISSLNSSLNKLTLDFKSCKSEITVKQEENSNLKVQIKGKTDSLYLLKSELENLNQQSAFNKVGKHNKPIHELDNNAIPENIIDNAYDCTDCWWYNYENQDLIGELIFIHDPKDDKLFFIYDGIRYKIPLISRQYKEGKTITDQPSGQGKLIFEGEGLKIIYEFSQGGDSLGAQGILKVFKNGNHIQELYIKSFVIGD
jgi:hypothetical protein